MKKRDTESGIQDEEGHQDEQDGGYIQDGYKKPCFPSEEDLPSPVEGNEMKNNHGILSLASKSLQSCSVQADSTPTGQGSRSMDHMYHEAAIYLQVCFYTYITTHHCILVTRAGK